MMKVNVGLWLAVLRTFKNRWEDIEFKYDNLTSTEKELMSEIEFNYLVNEITALDNEEKNGVVYTKIV